MDACEWVMCERAEPHRHRRLYQLGAGTRGFRVTEQLASAIDSPGRPRVRALTHPGTGSERAPTPLRLAAQTLTRQAAHCRNPLKRRLAGDPSLWLSVTDVPPPAF